MSKFKPIPIKAIPMELDSSFTPIEMLSKLNFKINEVILNINKINKEVEEIKENIVNDIYIYVDDKIANCLSESKRYTDEQIAKVLNNDVITAEDFDNLQMTAEIYDNMQITAYNYDTKSAQILIINDW